jgi:hypothetical protein
MATKEQTVAALRKMTLDRKSRRASAGGSVHSNSICWILRSRRRRGPALDVYQLVL